MNLSYECSHLLFITFFYNHSQKQFSFALLFHTAATSILALLLFQGYRQQLFNYQFTEFGIRLRIFSQIFHQFCLFIKSIFACSRNILLCSKAFQSYLDGVDPIFLVLTWSSHYWITCNAFLADLGCLSSLVSAASQVY